MKLEAIIERLHPGGPERLWVSSPCPNGPPGRAGGKLRRLLPHLSPPPIDVFKNALHLGTFSAVLVTYAASALLHVSRAEWDQDGSWVGVVGPPAHSPHCLQPHPRASASTWLQYCCPWHLSLTWSMVSAEPNPTDGVGGWCWLVAGWNHCHLRLT